MKIIGYVRVSTEEQDLGADAQKAAIERWVAGQEGAELVSMHYDLGISGATSLDYRPGLQDALNAVKANKPAMLVVAKRDRLARDVLISAMVTRLVQRENGRIVSVDGVGNGEGPEQTLLGHIIDAFAEYERALIRARTRAALQVKHKRHEFYGGSIPYGFKLGADAATLEVDQEERDIIEKMAQLKSESRSFKWIASWVSVYYMLKRRAAGYDNFANDKNCAKARLLGQQVVQQALGR